MVLYLGAETTAVTSRQSMEASWPMLDTTRGSMQASSSARPMPDARGSMQALSPPRPMQGPIRRKTRQQALLAWLYHWSRNESAETISV
jgi:hypothetical protein